jgi:hypothetical protein
VQLLLKYSAAIDRIAKFAGRCQRSVCDEPPDYPCPFMTINTNIRAQARMWVTVGVMKSVPNYAITNITIAQTKNATPKKFGAAF